MTDHVPMHVLEGSATTASTPRTTTITIRGGSSEGTDAGWVKRL